MPPARSIRPAAYASGSGSSTIASVTVTGSANVGYSGEYAIAAFAREQATAATMTYTPGSGWSNLSNDGTTSSRDHRAVDYLAGPTAGSAASTRQRSPPATSYAARVLIAFAFIPTSGPALVPFQQPPGVRVSLAVRRDRAWRLSSRPPLLRRRLRPPIPPRAQPVQAAWPRPPRGPSRASPGGAGRVARRASGHAAAQPVHAQRPCPRPGRSFTGPGRSRQGPAVAPLRRPVTSAVRVLPPRGHAAGMAAQERHRAAPDAAPRPCGLASRCRRAAPPAATPGTSSGTGPAVTPLQRPVAAIARPLPRRQGRLADRHPLR